MVLFSLLFIDAQRLKKREREKKIGKQVPDPIGRAIRSTVIKMGEGGEESG